MTKEKQKNPLPLNTVRIIRPKRVMVFASFCEALDALRPWVALGEGVRIFDEVFLLG